MSVVANESFCRYCENIRRHAYQCRPWVCRHSGGGLVWGMAPEAADVYIRPDPDHIVQLLLSAFLFIFQDLRVSPVKIPSRR